MMQSEAPAEPESRSPAAASAPPDGVLARGAPRWISYAPWVTWALLLGAHLALVGALVENVPLGDEWFTLASMLGVEPFDLEFLWRRHNEHRIPLPKLVMWACYHASGFDFRAAPCVYVLTLGAISAAAIVVARTLRGCPSLTDAVLPLLLLNWGHQENTLWGFQAQMIASASISLCLLFHIVRRRTPLRARSAAAASATVCLLALCGQNGVLLVPALSLWIGWSAWEQWRARGAHRWRDAAVIAGLAVLPLAMVGLVMYGLPLPPRTSSLPNLNVALEFLMNGLGRATEDHRGLATTFILGLIAMTGGLVVVRWRQSPSERYRLFGLVCFCGSVVSLALAMGFGRSSAFQLRYAILGVPFYCAVHFIWIAYGRSWWPRGIAIALLVASIA